MKLGEQMLVITSNLDEKTYSNERLRPMLRFSDRMRDRFLTHRP